MIKVMLADDHRVLVDSLQSQLSQQDDIECIGSVYDGREVMPFIEKHRVDIILMDINMPGLDGIETTKLVRSKYPEINVIALTMLDQPSMIRKMMKMGASGYLLKNAQKETLLDAIRTVYKGGRFLGPEATGLLFEAQENIRYEQKKFIPKLTRREIEVLGLIAQGYSVTEIAKELFISHHTAESHRKNLRSKFDVGNSAELVRVAMEKGFI